MRRFLPITAAILLSALSVSAKIIDRIIAQVNDDIITLSDVNRRVAEMRQQLAQEYSGERLEQELKNAEKMALDELIVEKLLVQKAVELGMGAQVDTQITQYIDNVRKQNNIKDLPEFEKVLGQQGLTIQGFREQIRRQILARNVVDNFVSSRITLLQPEVDRFYKDHAKDFRTIEEVSLSEIVIPVEGNNAAEAEAKAREVHKRLTQGEPFAALASQYSKGATAGKGGSIGSYSTPKLNTEILQAIGGLKDGEVSVVTKTKEGFVIYRLDSRNIAKQRPLEEVRSEIQKRMWDQKFQPEYERFVAQVKEDAHIQIFEKSTTK